MRKQLTHVEPLRAGVVTGLMYVALSFVAIPFVFIAALLDPKGGVGGAVFGLILAIMLPIIYGVLGFVSGVLCAFVYNILVKLVGGLVFEVRDEPSLAA